MPIDSSQALGIASSAAIASANNYSAAATNRKGRNFAVDRYNVERADALTDWQRQNEYNDPTSQMQRLRKAGLNPNLVYGNGADAQMAAPVRSADTQSWTPHAPQVDPATIGNEVSRMYNIKIQEAQYDNLKTQNTVLLEDAALKRSQRMNTDTNTSKQLTETNTAMFDLNMKNRLQDTYAETASENLRKLGVDIKKTQVDTQYTLDQNDRSAMQNAQTIRESVERILKSRAERSKIPSEISEINARIANLDNDTRIKEADAWLKEHGIQPHDSPAMRQIQKFLDLDTPGSYEDNKGGMKKILKDYRWKAPQPWTRKFFGN